MNPAVLHEPTNSLQDSTSVRAPSDSSLDAVPDVLRQHPQWVCWRFENRNGERTKVPINARTGRRAKATDPTTWSTFNEAVGGLRRFPGLEGVGFVFSVEDLFAGIDLDDCIDDNGQVVSSAQAIIDWFDSYTEISPSRRGIKIFTFGTKPKGAGCKSTRIEGYEATEVYDRKRFFTVTGQHLPGTPLTVENRQQQLDALCQRLWPPKPKLRLVGNDTGSNDLDDDELILRAGEAKNGEHFKRLFAGDTTSHGGDDSAADLALCSMLAFWTRSDCSRMDRLFRRSGLYREKWERADYRERTLQKAIDGCSEVYSGSKQRGTRSSSGEGDPNNPPEIVIGPDEHRVVDEAILALQSDPEIYQRGGLLVRVVTETRSKSAIVRRHGSVTIKAVPTANLRERLTKCAKFIKADPESEFYDVHPTGWMVKAVEARHSWDGIRPLMAIADTPILRPDGSICQKPGYDELTEVLLLPGQQFPDVPEDVDIDDAQAALEVLFEVVCNFRFEAPEHKAAWLAALLTPVARFAFSGPSPLFLVDANVRAAGKGLLIQTIGHIVQGHEMPASSYAHETEEMRKKITTIAIAGDRMINLDNIEGTFGNDALDRALTTTRWKDRILGKNDQVDLPLTTTWFASGNNVLVGADTARRIIHIRLDVLEERPELRSDFKHPNLIQWIDENRPRLLVAALTILRAYCRAGYPKNGLASFGSFEGWSDLVRGAVVWLGLADPCSTQLKLAEVADTTSDALRQLFQAWQQFDASGQGLILSPLTSTLYSGRLEAGSDDDAGAAMRAALENLVGTNRAKAPSAKQIGNKLRHYRRRVVDGWYLDFDEGNRRMGARWRLLRKETTP